jgi:hypothetical protein
MEWRRIFCDGGVLEMVDVCKFAVAIRIRKLQDQFGCFKEKIANTCRNRGTVSNSFLLSTYRPRFTQRYLFWPPFTTSSGEPLVAFCCTAVLVYRVRRTENVFSEENVSVPVVVSPVDSGGLYRACELAAIHRAQCPTADTRAAVQDGVRPGT